MVKPKLTIENSRVTIEISENVKRILEARYFRKDRRGKPLETIEGLFKRVARSVAEAELNYDQGADIQGIEDDFFSVMASLAFLPNSPTLFNAGNTLGQLSACFVLPIEDSIQSIFETAKNSALIQKTGGGTGFSFSHIRPKNDRVKSSGGTASGPVSFIKAYDSVTQVIAQGGMRRGANMGILAVNHPDIMEFISIKEDTDTLANFNLSVAVTSEFMEAVKNDEEYRLINPRSNSSVKKENARDVFNRIVSAAWKTGEPGLIFIDRMNKDNPTPELGYFECTNPCGEQPLLPYESCNLGSINLSRMIRNNAGTNEIDYHKLGETIRTAVRFLDNVIDINKYPLPEIKEATLKTRKIGLGVMGFADMLVQLEVPYNSDDAIQIASSLMDFINKKAVATSRELALKRGPFPAFPNSIYDIPDSPAVRNATCTTIAPTGSISMIAGCSSGIEPIYQIVYKHQIFDKREFIEINPLFQKITEQYNVFSDDLIDQMKKGINLSEIPSVPDSIKKIFVTAYDVAPEFHVLMQAAFQHSTQNAVSKTVNLPYGSTSDDVAKVFMLAYENSLKGITVYVDQAREQQPLSTLKTSAALHDNFISPKPRQQALPGITEKIQTGCGTMYITLNQEEGQIFEVFSVLGKAGNCISAQLEAIARLVSLSLRSGVSMYEIVKQLSHIHCPATPVALDHNRSVYSCPDAISIILEKHTHYSHSVNSTQSEVVTRRRPVFLHGTTHKIETGCGHLYITANSDENGDIFELFSVLGKAGACPSAQLSAISRLISLALRSAISPAEISHHLQGIRCPSPPILGNADKVSSCADALAVVLNKYSLLPYDAPDEQIPQQFRQTGNITGICPDCSNFLVFQEGCSVCRSCGYNRC